MIFVTVGTHTKSFNRLLEEIDSLVLQGKVKEDVIAQIGYSSYEPKKVKWFRFADYKKMKDLNQNARVVITHGGVGSILTALIHDKPVIAVPRTKKFSEHTDDHQTELVKRLSKENKVRAVFDIKELGNVLEGIGSQEKVPNTKKKLIEELKHILSNIEKEEIVSKQS